MLNFVLFFLREERGEERKWDEWGRRGNVGPPFFRTPSSLPFSLFSPFFPKKKKKKFNI